ncbi:MAG: hypothetical protein ACM3SP_08020 [Chloroflexota bacterium]
MKAVRVHNFGGAEALKIDDIPIPEAKAGEARAAIGATGVSFIDIYHRTGLLKTTLTLGTIGASVVETVRAKYAPALLYRGPSTHNQTHHE